MSMINDLLIKDFGISTEILELANNFEKKVLHIFEDIDKIKQFNQYKVISALQKNRLSDVHFGGTTGYGYGDSGREVLDLIYKDIFKSEDALVRHQIVCGTQALAVCMFAILRPKDELLSITGKPYDTLEEVIGLRGSNNGSLKEFGVSYTQQELNKQGKIDLENIKNSITKNTKLVLVQRSKGYALRPSVSIQEIKEAIKVIKNIRSDLVVMVDNCYGEFVEEMEPTEVGADLVAGSLIKNPGGGIALSGGYVAGRKEHVQSVAYRLTAPGLGRKVGATLGNNRFIAQGIFMAPHVVSESLKGAIFCAEVMKGLGFEVYPGSNDQRTDIIQAIKFGNPECLIAFCQGIQKGCAVDAFVTPEPWDMPGYDAPVIMASGSFVQGSSIELSADAPIKPPYAAYMQGGIIYENIKLGVMAALQNMKDKQLIKI